MKSALKHTRAYQELRRWRTRLQRGRTTAKDQKAQTEFEQFCYEHGGLGLWPNLIPQGVRPKTALIVSLGFLPLPKLEAWLIKVLQMAGFETVVLGNRRPDFLRYYDLAGTKAVHGWSDFGNEGDPVWIKQELDQLKTLRDWLALDYQGVHVGRFAIASAMRNLKRGQLDFADPAIQQELLPYLESSVRYALSGMKVLDRVRPDCVFIIDRGYAGQGELFDLGIKHGIDVFTWNGGHKSNRLFFKRYNSGNEREHQATLSADSWRRICAIPWKQEYGRRIREELFQCYQTQDWYSSVGTQFGKEVLSAQETREKLGLRPDQKVAVIFPHILWDGSFFCGKDVFDDYTHWLAETIKAACNNPRLQWVVKLHPSHVVKARKEKIDDRPQELGVIENVIDDLPDHVKLVYPETDISTYSLFQIADYAVTVRGTVGIEAALFGVPVVTAGTGRYDQRGFTLDSDTQSEYLERLATLETQPPLTAKQVELAERFAYGVFLCRPVSLSSVSLEFERDAVATWKVTINCQTREEWLESPDARRLSEWINGKSEDMMDWNSVRN
jgi:hypothetical protein